MKDKLVLQPLIKLIGQKGSIPSIRSIGKYRVAFTNLSYKVAGLLAKFLLIIFISKEMSLSDLGLYNIFAVTVAWSVYAIGFEFHSYSFREIVGAEKKQISLIFSNQLTFHVLVYVFVGLVSIIAYIQGLVPLKILLFFTSITLLDQVTSEFYRLFIALHKSNVSNLIFFLKSGLWIYALLALIPFFKVDMDWVLAAWCIGALLSFGVCLWGVRTAGLDIKLLSNPDFKWIGKGLKVSLPFLISIITAVTISFADRYFIDHYLGKSAVGVYSFFYGIVVIPASLIVSVIVAQYYPIIIEQFRHGTEKEQKKVLLGFLMKNLAIFFLFSAGAALFIKPLLLLIDKSPLLNNLNLFFLMMLEGFIFSFTVVIQAVLYAKYKDMWLMYTSLVGVVCNLLLNYFLIPIIGLYGATIATLISLVLIDALRVMALKVKGEMKNIDKVNDKQTLICS